MNTTQIAGKTYITPASYNELNQRQLLAICKVLQSGNRFIKFKILQILFTCSTHTNIFLHWYHTRRTLKSFVKIPPPAATYFANDTTLTGWIYESANLTNYTINKFRYKGITYYGPHDDILNISVAEWVETAMYFTAYTQSLKTDNPNHELLDKIIAVLYRPGRLFYHLQKITPTFNIDRRRANNLYRFTRRTHKFNKLSPALKLAIFLQYESAYAKFPESFPDAFGSKGENGEADINSWVSLLMAMSNDIFGDYEKTQQIDAYTFFTKVNANINQSNELKAKYNKS